MNARTDLSGFPRDVARPARERAASVHRLYCAYLHEPSLQHYCSDPPFDPPAAYPELPGSATRQVDASNLVYPAVRQLLLKLGLDAANAGTARWNPFGALIRPGDTVVIKPNLVTHHHYLGRDHLYSTVVHGSVLRPLLDYSLLALGDTGRVIIADNPVEGADFAPLMEFTGIARMARVLRARGYRQVEVLDLRPRVLCEAKDGSFLYRPQPGDPLGYVQIDLGRDSLFAELDGKPDLHYYTLADPAVDHVDPRYCGSSTTDRFHNATTHRYLVSRSVLAADAVINVAKMKCHCKAGVSLCLKNMIGVVYEKHCMPHHRPGPPPLGDSFPHYPAAHYVLARKAYVRLRRWLRIHRWPGFRRLRNGMQKKGILVGQHIEHGNWKGNDTIWRTILDLNRIVLYADRQGVMRDSPQRRMFCLIDGIISQQGDAPINGEAVPTGVLVGGFNPVLTDELALRLMGIERNRIRTVDGARDRFKWPLLCTSQRPIEPDSEEMPNLQFKLAKGWR